MLKRIAKAASTAYDAAHDGQKTTPAAGQVGEGGANALQDFPIHASLEKGVREDGKTFVYDQARPFLYRLFQLDLPDSSTGTDDDAPLSGKLMSLTFDQDIREYFHTFKAAIREDRSEVMKALSGTDEYIAVSYSWGTSSDRWPIYLTTVSCFLGENSQVLTDHEPQRHGYIWITSSARSFLQGMRRQRERRFLWIDAICIDQVSEQDKANQIPQMREVYASAEVVYVWLGKASNSEEMALRMMPNVVAKLKNCSPSRHNSVEAAFEEAGLPEPGHDIWKAYASILTRDWWSRLWTFQELAMADELKNAVEYELLYKAPSAFVWCGGTKTPWEQFDFFAEAVGDCGLKTWLITGQESLVWDHLHGLDAIAEVRTGRESLLRYGWGASLSALLVATRRRKASEPIDMVWGMYALLDKAARKELALERSMSAQEVFIRFAKHYIRSEVKECILNHTATFEKLTGLPSWCPNFASREETTPIGTRWYGHYQESSWLKAQMPCAGFQKTGPWALPRSRAYYAKYITNAFQGKHSLHGLYATDNPRQISLIPGTNTIIASGIHIDTIIEVIPYNPGAESTSFLSYNSIQQTSAWDTICFSLAQRTLTSKRTSTSKYDLYARTLTANRVTASFNETTAPTESWGQVVKGIVRSSPDSKPDHEIVFDREEKVDFAAKYLAFRNFIQATMDIGESIPAKGNLDPSAHQFTQCLHLMSRRRTFFATKAGRIGIGPSDAKPGDKVVVIFYCPTPYLIRLSKREDSSQPGGEWEFVGEAYVNGLMYGEALRMFDEGKVQETKWTIR